jgi:hypothetical protein
MSDMIYQECGLIVDEGKSFSLKVDGKTIVCSEHVLSDLVILRVKSGYEDKINDITDLIASRETDFTRRVIVILPPYIEVLKPIPSPLHEETTQCNACGGTMRILGQDEWLCNSCGATTTRKMKHLHRIMTGEGGGVSRL